MRRSVVVLSLLVLLASPLAAQNGDWPHYGRDPGGERHSPLTEIDTANVSRLVVAWRFSTGEADSAYAAANRTSFEATPLVIDGVMYLSTPIGRVFALDARTGAERWRFDAQVDRAVHYGDHTNRGVSYWVDGRAAARSVCARRIIVGTIDARLLALDATTGRPCTSFGDKGTVTLRSTLRNKPRGRGDYELTSPPAVVNDILVVGSAIADNSRTDEASGEVRGIDARTGRVVWTWDPIPQDPRDPAYATWRGRNAHRTGAANAWSVLAGDPARDLVFIPTSSPSTDYYGGERLGEGRYANSVVALNASTGAMVWHFQTVHHDLWDFDNAAPPALVTIRKDGRDIPAVLQATKSGMLYALDRTSGIPVWPVEERAVPRSTVPGEEANPTQPFSTLPPLSPHSFDIETAGGADSADRAACRAMVAGLRNEGIFTPPSLEGTVMMPSNIGGAHWGGVAFDPVRQLAVIPVNRLAAQVQLIRRDQFDGSEEEGWEYAQMRNTPYLMRRRFLLSPARLPCTPPPFGELVAIDLAHGTTAWRIPLGAFGAIGATRSEGGAAAATPAALTGSPNLGGPITTAGGVTFIAATLDRKLHAYETATGRLLWEGQLPAGGKATPMTYSVEGRQYVAISAGGDGGFFGKGDEVLVFTLPRR